MDYDLSRLGSRDFEHLSQALTLAVLGPQVRVFGDGPDGGREATFDGVVAYPRPGGSWNGYGVVQAKYRQRLLGTGSDTQWLHTQLRSELDRWVTDRAEARPRRKRSPEYLLITTNVPLSAVPGSGGIDTTLALIASYADRLGLKGWDVWAYDKINRFLDGHQDIRRAYGPFVAVGDVFGRLDELIASTAVDVGALLVRHAAKELVARQAVRLGQAGHTDPSYRLPLAKVAIDVPGQRMDDPDSDPLEVVRYILEGGDRIRRPSHAHEPIRHIALIGAPGQGKTTLGQLVCQAYRTAILASRPRTALSAEAGDLVDQLRNELRGLGYRGARRPALAGPSKSGRVRRPRRRWRRSKPAAPPCRCHQRPRWGRGGHSRATKSLAQGVALATRARWPRRGRLTTCPRARPPVHLGIPRRCSGHGCRCPGGCND